MSGIGGCRSSGVITADKIIFKGRGKLVSIHGISPAAPNEAYIQLYDNTSASGDVIGILYVGGPLATAAAESDYHGVIFKNGLYADITHVAGTATMFTVEFN